MATITIHAPVPNEGVWKPGDLVTLHFRVAGVDGEEHVLEAADVIRQDHVEAIHAGYHQQLEDLSTRAAAQASAQRDQHLEEVARLQERHVAELAGRDATIKQLQAALESKPAVPVSGTT
jgi:hypothetical protein